MALPGLRNCPRYLRITAMKSAVGPGMGQGGQDMDPTLAAAGRLLEEVVAYHILQHAAPGCRSLPADDRPVTWEAFLDLLSNCPTPQPGGPPVTAWAGDVQLEGTPWPDSVASLSGRADFIFLYWDAGFPVLRIVECKASAEPSTSHLLQLCAYRALLLAKLSCGARVAGDWWDVEGRRLRVECVLCLAGVPPGGQQGIVAPTTAVTAPPLLQQEVRGASLAISY